LPSQAVGPKLWWLQRHEPDIWARTARWFSASSFWSSEWAAALSPGVGAFRKESTRTLLALEAHAAQQSLT
jgi:ribulose kinase